MKQITKPLLFLFLIIFGINLNLYAMGARPKKTATINKEDAKKLSAIEIEPEIELTKENSQNKPGKLLPPVYLSTLSNINDYYAFATSGWDGSWYVGYNACWIVKLPMAPEGGFEKAYIGVKLGRMKSIQASGKPPWEKQPIPGELFVGLSSTPAWKSSQTYFLTSTKDIPLEGDMLNAQENVGESRWFWTEVPIKQINFNGPNFVATWSETDYIISTASGPILAGGWGNNEVTAWVNSDINGYAPMDPETSLKTGISIFEPAIIIKLIPKGCEQEIGVSIADIKEGKEKTLNKTFITAVTGDSIEKGWLEILIPKEKAWTKHGPYIYTPPFMHTLKASGLPKGRIKVRAIAVDVWGNIGISEEIDIEGER